jgi:hypothetical protein
MGRLKYVVSVRPSEVYLTYDKPNYCSLFFYSCYQSTFILILYIEYIQGARFVRAFNIELLVALRLKINSLYTNSDYSENLSS